MTNTNSIKKGFSGTWPDLLTPVKPDLSVDLHRLETHIRTLFFKGVSGVVLFGHSGEGTLFGYAEKFETLNGLIKAGIDPKSMMLSVTSNSVPDSVRLINLAESLGLYGVLVSPPFYYKPVLSAGLIHYFEHLISQIKSPNTKFYIHLLPNSTHLEIPEASLFATIERWGAHIYGIVNQTDSNSVSDDLRKTFVDKVMIYSCKETDLKRLSPTGTISLMANIVPRVLSSILKGQQSGQTTVIPGMKDKSSVDNRAAELQVLVAKYPLIASYKFLLSLLYRDVEWRRCRPPLSPLDQTSCVVLEKEFKKFNIQPNEE
jgi:4-hydroxy-tetrahydrodipicolinate synthase